MKPQRTVGAAPGLAALGLVLVTTAATLGVERWVGHGRDVPKEPAQVEAPSEKEEVSPVEVVLDDAKRANARLELATAGPGTVFVSLSLPGEVGLNTDALAHVTPRVGGTVRAVNRKLGDVVKRGDVLGILDSREVADLQRDAASTAARYDLAQQTLSRLEPLREAKVTSEKDYAAAKEATNEARIDRDTARAKLAAAGSSTNLGGYALVAPFDGTIIEKHMNVGEVVKDDTRVFVIADLSSVWVDLSVYARDLPRVEVGQTVRVRAEGIEAPALGTIGFIGAVASEETRSARARVVLENPGPAWRPGLFATAEVAIDSAQASVVVPDEAVQTIDHRPSLFVEKGNAFEVHPVEIGRFGKDASGRAVVEVVRGLGAGERYVVVNAFTLKAELSKSAGGEED